LINGRGVNSQFQIIAAIAVGNECVRGISRERERSTVGSTGTLRPFFGHLKKYSFPQAESRNALTVKAENEERDSGNGT
jgi:hypothetical protein